MDQKDSFLNRPRTKAELCDWLGCTPRFLEREISHGHLRVRKLSSRLIRILPADIQAWLDRASTTALEKDA
jgi:hypothetical protein